MEIQRSNLALPSEIWGLLLLGAVGSKSNGRHYLHLQKVESSSRGSLDRNLAAEICPAFRKVVSLHWGPLDRNPAAKICPVFGKAMSLSLAGAESKSSG